MEERAADVVSKVAARRSSRPWRVPLPVVSHPVVTFVDLLDSPWTKVSYRGRRNCGAPAKDQPSSTPAVCAWKMGIASVRHSSYAVKPASMVLTAAMAAREYLNSHDSRIGQEACPKPVVSREAFLATSSEALRTQSISLVDRVST